MEQDKLVVEYIGSYQQARQCPDMNLPEYCFIGRSNVGKSSIINYVTGVNEIARTSKKPGKTQSINLFRVKDTPEWAIADLPGYGYAQVSKSTRGAWSALIDGYIGTRENLVCTFLLIDIRHIQQENDRQFMNHLGQNGIPFCILFTKSDKLKTVELQNALVAYQQAILEEWEEMPPFFVTSSVAKLGRMEVLDYIHQLNTIFSSQHPRDNE